jgi:hypothetical protein
MLEIPIAATAFWVLLSQIFLRLKSPLHPPRQHQALPSSNPKPKPKHHLRAGRRDFVKSIMRLPKYFDGYYLQLQDCLSLSYFYTILFGLSKNSCIRDASSQLPPAFAHVM